MWPFGGNTICHSFEESNKNNSQDLLSTNYAKCFAIFIWQESVGAKSPNTRTKLPGSDSYQLCDLAHATFCALVFLALKQG